MAELFSDQRINEALHLLNEVAKDKRAELAQMIAVKYGNLKSMLEGIREEIERESADAYRRGKDQVSHAVKEVDQSVHAHPWPYIAGAALTALILGYLFGNSRR
ncbi:MAG TPA: hypothetical protein VLY45_04770 [Nitrospiria bacterium]|nr:hypothetical protein [Nitrospiria bacterium]